MGNFGSFPRKTFRIPGKPKLGVIVGVKNKKKATKTGPRTLTKKQGPTKARRVKPSTLGYARKEKEREAKKPAPPPVQVESRPHYGPPRSGIAIVGQFTPWPWGQHPDEAYLADAIESLGIPVYRVRQDWACAPIHDCDFVLFTGQPNSWGKIQKWSSTHRTILWTLDWLPDYSERHDIIHAARRVTYFVSSDRFDWKGRYGIRNHVYLPGACESAGVEFKPNPTRPCAFMGSLYNDRRTKIAGIVRRMGGEVLDSPGSWLYGDRLAQFVQSTKVIVGDNARNDIPGYWSSRNYVVPGAGGFLLTSNVPGLERDFVFGRHLAVYDGIEVLEEAIQTCLHLDEEREEIRKMGFEHVHANHSWRVRAKTLIQYLKIPTR